MPNLSQLSENLLSLFLHPNCPFCGRSAKRILCQSCEHQLDQCQCSQPKFQGKGKISVLAWGDYGGLLKQSIFALKYEKKVQLARPLGERLAQTWLKTTHLPASLKPAVVPIPLHPDKQKKRGFNQAALIARSFSEVTKLPFQPQGLQRIKNTVALYDLSPEAREKELLQAFLVGKGLQKQQTVVLLDDIYTTGATVQAARIALQQVGIKVVGVCAIAKA